MPIRLRPLTPCTGEDLTASPQFQMVPQGQARLLHMTGNEGGAWSIEDSAGLVQCTMQGGQAKTQLRLFGRSPGKVQLLWQNGRHLDPEGLEVAVLPSRRFRVAFRFVSVGDGNVSTQRPQSDVAPMFRMASTILREQANVILEDGGSRPLLFERSFGRIVDVRNGVLSNDARRLSAQRDVASDVTVFFVRTLDNQDDPGNQIGVSHRSDNSYICIEDYTSGDDPGLILAHELVHNLGDPNHSGGQSHLMVTGSDRNNRFGRRLTKAQILRINSGWRSGR